LEAEVEKFTMETEVDTFGPERILNPLNCGIVDKSGKEVDEPFISA
jgi:hypothetical protein